MAQEIIDIGAQADDGSGDTIRRAGLRINTNFTEVYALPAHLGDIKFRGNNITSESSNADIVLSPSGTGNVVFPTLTFEDNNIKTTGANQDILVKANGAGKVIIGGIGFSGTSISAPDSTSVNINENLIVDGSGAFGGTFAFSGAQTFPTGSVFGTQTYANGSITDSTGAISFGNENLTTTGTLSAGTGSALGNITFANGSITDSSGAIAFGNENLSTTGTITAGSGSTFGNLTLANGSITDSSGAISFGNENLTTTATSIAINSTLTVANGSITDSSGAISFGNENVTTSGTITRATGSTIGNLTLANGSITDSSGAISFGNENLTTTSTSIAINNTLTVANGSITDSGGAISFGNENVTTTGTIARATGSTIGNLTLANGSITDSSGAISFGNENLTTTSTSIAINNTLTVANGSITDSSGAISFVNENLTTTGTIARATGSTIGNLTLANGSITDSSGTISFGNENLTTSASSMAINNTLSAGSGSITDTTGAISFSDDNLTTTGTLDVSGLTTLGSMATVSGVTSFAASTTVDNLNFNDNIISTSSNADLVLTPGGTGVVNVSNLTIDSSINLKDNVIKVTRSNDNLVLNGNGSGNVEIITGLTTGAVTTTGNVVITGNKTITGLLDLKGMQIKDNTISTDESNSNLELSGNGSGNPVVDKVEITSTTIDNIVIGANTPAAGTFSSFPTFSNTNEFDAAGVKLKDNTITAHRSNDDLEFEANGSGYVNINGILNLPNSDGTVGQLIQTDGSGQLSWASSPILFGVSTIQDTSQTITFTSISEIDHVTAVGSHNRIESGTAVQNSFATSKYDSAWYLAVNRDDASDEFEVIKHSVVHNNSNAFITSSIRAKTGTNNHVTSTVDISSGSVRLLGTGNSPENSVSFYRIGLGDDDSTGYSGEDEAAVVINTDVDSASEVIDSWAHGSFRGAKYYISVNNASKTECSNIECNVVHNGTTAFISTYNIVNTGNNDLVTLTAAINGSNVEVKAAGLEPNLRVHAYRIILADNEADRSSTNINVIGDVTVSSSTTTLDTFSTGTYQAAHYVIVSHNASEGHSAICEAAVVSDGTNAFVTQYGLTSTKGTDQILLSVGHAGSTTTLSATSTSGGSTKVNAYRVNLTRGPGTSTATTTIDSVSASTFRSAKYNVQVVDEAGGNYELFEANVTHDGSTAYISTFGAVGSSTGLITITADVDSGNLRLRGTINNTNDHVVKVVRRVINA